jgi:hypothetical protein
MNRSWSSDRSCSYKRIVAINSLLLLSFLNVLSAVFGRMLIFKRIRTGSEYFTFMMTKRLPSPWVC